MTTNKKVQEELYDDNYIFLNEKRIVLKYEKEMKKKESLSLSLPFTYSSLIFSLFFCYFYNYHFIINWKFFYFSFGRSNKQEIALLL
jgi:hypothetical protein